MITAASILKMALPAAQKAGTLIFQKVGRLQHIDDAIAGIENDEIAKTAVSDFEIVKGSWRGEFDTSVDKFLRALEASGLCQLLFNNALVKSRSPSIQAAFIDLFVAETGQDRFNGELLYKQVASSFEVTVEYLSKDPVLVRAIRSSHQALAESIASVEAALGAIRAGIQNRPSAIEIAEAVPRILRSVIGDTKYIKVETSQGRQDVDISKLYISPNLMMRNLDQHRSSVKLMVDQIAEKVKNNTKLANEVSATQRLDIERLATSVNLEEIENVKRTIVLGNPGGGKSTLLQSICYKIASNSIKKINEGGYAGDIQVPIRIVLRDYEHARLSHPQLNLVEYIVNDLLNAAYNDKAVLAKCVENLLATGQAYLAFDGLDEILKIANRRQFVDLVNRFVRQYPLCQVLVTSRLVGYEKAPLPADDYEEVVLGDFGDSDVRTYAERFIRFVGKRRVADAREAASHFMSQTAQNAGDLRKNPLMLGLMMWIYNIRDDVPSNRPEIYEECARLMFERWDGERNIIVELPQTFDRLQVFSYLASKIFDNQDNAAGVSAKWIERALNTHLCEVLESAPQARAASSSLIQFIIDRSWVMSEKGEGVFSFTHQTFLEYFFAKYNDDSYDTVDDLMAYLIPHIVQDEWDVVSRLSLQIKTYRNRRRQDEAINILIRTLDLYQNMKSELKSVLGFATRCLEFLVGSESNIRALIEKVLSSISACYEFGTSEVMELVPDIYTGSRERRSFVADAVEAWLIERFRDGSDEDRDFVLACVDGVTGKFRRLSDDTGICSSIPLDHTRRIRGSLMELILPDVSRNPKLAKTLYEWTGTIPKQALTLFGPSFIYFARPSVSFNVDGLSAMALAASDLYSEVFTNTQFTKTKCLASLGTFGSYFRKVGLDHVHPFPNSPGLSNPPSSIWANMLNAIRGDADTRLGACITCLLTLETHGLSPRDINPSPILIAALKRHSRFFVRLNDDIAIDMLNFILNKFESTMAADTVPGDQLLVETTTG